MDFFFFGTLMDADVLALVLGRRIGAAALEPAELAGYRLVHARDETYPVLAPATGVRVEGRLVRGLTEADVARIAFYEADEFETRCLTVRAGDERIEAQVQVGAAGDLAMAREWRFADWQEAEKADYLVLVRAWMDLYGSHTVAEAEAVWERTKAALAPPAQAGARSG